MPHKYFYIVIMPDKSLNIALSTQKASTGGNDDILCEFIDNHTIVKKSFKKDNCLDLQFNTKDECFKLIHESKNPSLILMYDIINVAQAYGYFNLKLDYIMSIMDTLSNKSSYSDLDVLIELNKFPVSQSKSQQNSLVIKNTVSPSQDGSKSPKKSIKRTTSSKPQTKKKRVPRAVNMNTTICNTCKSSLSLFPYIETCCQCKQKFHKKCVWGSFFLSDKQKNNWLCNQCICGKYVLIYDANLSIWRLAQVQSSSGPYHFVIFQDTTSMLQVKLGDYRLLPYENISLIPKQMISSTAMDTSSNGKELTFKSLLVVDEKLQVEKIYMRRYNPRHYIECLVKFSQQSPLSCCWIPQNRLIQKNEDVLLNYLLSFSLRSNVWKKYISKQEDVYYHKSWSPLMIPDFQILNMDDEAACCNVCDTNDDLDKLLLCDRCDSEYHIYCLDPPLKKVPEEGWLCPLCKNYPEKTPKYPRHSSFFARFQTGERSRYETSILSAYPYGIELIHRYRREDERIQDKNCWSLGEEERPSILPPLSSKEIEQFIFHGDELHEGTRYLFSYQIPVVARLESSFYTYKHNIYLYENGSFHRSIIASLLHILFTLNVFEDPIILICEESMMSTWESILRQWTGLRIEAFTVSSSLRKEQWTDHFGTTKDPVICDLDLVIISDKAVRRKSSVDLAVMSTIMWSYVIIDNYTKLITDKDLDSFFSSITSNLTYEHFLVAINSKVVRRSTDSLISMRLMKQFIVHDYDAQIPQKTDIYSPQTLNRQEEIERWTAILNSELDLSYEDLEEKFQCITVSRSSKYPATEIREIVVPCLLSSIQERAIRSVYERWKPVLNRPYNPWIAADKENILSLYYELALAYDHPYLLGGIEQVLHCLYPNQSWEKVFMYSSGKIYALSLLISLLKKNNINRVILYSRNTTMLQLLYKFVQTMPIQSKLLYGPESLQYCLNIVNEIKESDEFTLLLLGDLSPMISLPLGFITNVILFDSSIDPQMDIDLLQKSHNIGTYSSLSLYHLTMVGTLETLIFDPQRLLRSAFEKAVSDDFTALRTLIIISISNLDSEAYKKYSKEYSSCYSHSSLTIFTLSPETHTFDSNSYLSVKSTFPMYINRNGPLTAIPEYNISNSKFQNVLEMIWNATSINDFLVPYSYLKSALPNYIIDSSVSYPHFPVDINELHMLSLCEFCVTQFLAYSYTYMPSYPTTEENLKTKKVESYDSKRIVINVNGQTVDVYQWVFTMKTAMYRLRYVLNYHKITATPYFDLFEELYVHQK